MEIEIVRNEERLRQLRPQWTELLHASHQANPFLSYEWFETTWKHFALAAELCVIVGWRGKEAVAIAPLVIGRREGFRCLGFPGPNLADYEEFLLSPSTDESVVTAIAEAATRNAVWDVWHMARIPADSALSSALEGQLQASSAGAPYLTLDGDWNQFWSTLKKAFRTDSLRAARKLEADIGRIEFRAIADEDEFARMFPLLVAQHRTRRNSLDRSMFNSSVFVSYYRDLARELRAVGHLSFTAMCAGSDVVALHYGLRYRNRFVYWLPTFDARFARYSVGRLLLLHLIERSYSDGIREFDLGYGEEPYKLLLKPVTRPMFSLMARGAGARGRLAGLWFTRVRPSLQNSAEFRRVRIAIRGIASKIWKEL
jgi:CelD/BcsL family acetyltransferase involved in cellulose biosynthesis